MYLVAFVHVARVQERWRECTQNLHAGGGSLFSSEPWTSCCKTCLCAMSHNASPSLLRPTLTLAWGAARAGAPFIFCAVMLLVALGLALTISPAEVEAARADSDPTLAEPLLLGEPRLWPLRPCQQTLPGLLLGTLLCMMLAKPGCLPLLIGSCASGLPREPRHAQEHVLVSAHMGARLTLPGLHVSCRQGRGEGPGADGQAAGAGRAAGPPTRRARLLQAAAVAARLAGRAVLAAALAAVALRAGAEGSAGPRGAHKRRHPHAVERRRRGGSPARSNPRPSCGTRALRAPLEPCIPGGACGGGGGRRHRGRPRRGWHRGDCGWAGRARAGGACGSRGCLP